MIHVSFFYFGNGKRVSLCFNNLTNKQKYEKRHFLCHMRESTVSDERHHTYLCKRRVDLNSLGTHSPQQITGGRHSSHNRPFTTVSSLERVHLHEERIGCWTGLYTVRHAIDVESSKRMEFHFLLVRRWRRFASRSGMSTCDKTKVKPIS